MEVWNDERVPNRSSITCQDRIKSKLPILLWITTYSFSQFLHDLLAGFTVTLTQIPQGIAYAIIAGLPTQYGLYCSIMGGVVYFFFGTCKDINIGPTAILSLFVQNSVRTLGPAGGILITFLSGAVIFIAGILRLGFLVEFFSFPIISGFTTAAALSIASSQLKQLLGIPGPASVFLEAWISFFTNITEAKKWDSILGVISIVFLFGFREIRRFGSLKHKPEWSRNRNTIGKCIFLFSLGGNAIVIIAGTSIAFVADKYYNATPVKLTGDVARGLPAFSLPPFTLNYNGTYYSFGDMLAHYNSLLAFIPLVAFLGHVSIVKAFTKGKVIDNTQELIALGLCNMAGSFIQSMPVTGSFTRTAVNNASGVRTTTSGLITSFMIVISLVLLTGALKYIPKATLAAVIVVAMYYLCDFIGVVVMWKMKRA
ncbi:hypothetical protein ABEB36_014429 [Hypothenemus hampei]|uniref:SLC26A/SulP transporter domain-containing protein n=1 Tax=Hypothenemus hampei TaxID=57062 RepID=A0ABD1E2N4_HYPHA